MRFRDLFLYFLLLTPFFIFSQTKNTSTFESNQTADSISLNKNIENAFSLALNFKYNNALTLILKSIKKSDSLKNDFLLGKSYIVNGIINMYLGNKTQTLLSYSKAEAIFKKTKNYNYLGSTYNNIGLFYTGVHSKRGEKNLDSTLYYYKKAVDFYTIAKNNRLRAVVLSNLGLEYVKLKEFDKAESFIKKSFNVLKNTPVIANKNYYLCLVYISYSDLYRNQKKFDKSLKTIKLAEKIALKNQFEDHLLKIYFTKHKILAGLGHYTKASAYLKKYQKKNEKAFTNQKSRLTQEMSAKFGAKQQKELLEKNAIEKELKEVELKNSQQIIFLIKILLVFSFIAIFLLYRSNNLKFKSNKQLKIKQQELKNLQLKVELFFLKKQIQPHFFFNTLNNLYSLILIKSEKAENVIQKLSELMKYALNNDDLNNITTPIQQEIKSLRNYLELESLRYQKIASTNIQIEGKMSNIKVPPLLYITFLENCFKHNNINDENFKIFISFKNIDSKYLQFTVKNTLISKTKEEGEEKRTGIGIENIKRRLQLIYTEDYKLNIFIKDNMYWVKLKTPITFKTINNHLLKRQLV